MNKLQVKFTMDGNQWCAFRSDFKDLQSSIVGFGDNKSSALKDLLLNETQMMET